MTSVYVDLSKLHIPVHSFSERKVNFAVLKKKNMLSFEQARDIAEKHLDIPRNSGDKYDIIIIEKYIIERPYAWIFPYNTKGAIEGDILYALGGNSPVFVDRHDGTISRFPSYLSMEGMIDVYEEQRKSWHLKLTINIYSEISKLLTLKRLLNLSQNELAVLKAKEEAVLDKGAQTRLKQLSGILSQHGINTEVLLAD
ncbi:YrhB domain-containing protein [Chitinophaga sp. CF418]|uniref:YrhB domain-containing protein n=1 Tax=Chitinophaga sp. CF418 TaxID=1855287 RepID=UPI00090F1095|nr:YrhB domain-containing protein [Chitinophaga sp. CF418]SHN40633.1 Immunity protein 35 [Chitinophaga sp. CF418]